MAEAVRIEISLPLEDTEKVLQRIYLDKALPVDPIPIETPPGITLSERILSEGEKQAVDAIRRGLRLLEELEAMGRLSPIGQKLGEDLPPLDKLTRIVQKIYAHDWEAANEEEIKALRVDCLKRLKVFEALALTLQGRYSAVFRMEVPVKNLLEIESMVQESGAHWVMRNLGAADSHAGGKGILSRLLGSKK